MKGWIKKRKRHAETDIQEDAIIRRSNCFKCCLDGIPMMKPELRLPQQGTLSPHVRPHAVCCFPETRVSMWAQVAFYACLKGKSVQVSTRVCVRDPHLQAEGGIIDVLTTRLLPDKLALLWHEEVVHTPACLFLFLSLTDTHTNCLSAQPCVANLDVQDYSGKKYIDLPTHDLVTNLLFWYCGWNITRIHTAFTH